MPLKNFSTSVGPANTRPSSQSLNINSTSNNSPANNSPATNNPKQAAAAQESSAAGKSIHIDLSDYGLKKSRNENKNQDIDDSDLPHKIKNTLKAIRELKEILHKKTLELKQLMANKGLSEEQRDEKAHQLQTEIAMINSALLSTMNGLVDTLKEEGLSLEQTASFAQLLMA